MAIKVSGTTVINDSQNIENITTINGTDWATVVSNAAEGAEVDLNELTDVTIGTLASGEVLYYDGSEWINSGLSFSDISGVLADSQVAESNVTQHEAALSITESQISDLGTTILENSDIGVNVQAYSANLDSINQDLSTSDDVTFNNITVTGTVDGRDIATDGTKLDTIETNAKDDQNASEVPFTNTTSGLIATDVQDAIDEVEGRLDTAETKLSGIETGATGDQTASEIKTAYESNSDTNAFTDAEQTKLSGIEANATADQTDSEIKTAYENNSDTNAFTDAEKTKLSGIETAATADQTGAEIKALYEAETNAFTDAQFTKLAGIEANADVTDTANVTAAGALMDSEVTNLADVKAFDPADYATATQGTTADDALPKAGGTMTGNITFNSTQTFDGRNLSTDGAKLDNIEANADVTDTTNVTAAGALMKTGGTMTGTLILNADPTSALQAATKEYVDTIAAAGIHYHEPVRVETPSNLNATYNNGTAGVGATLTNSGTQAALVIDGVTVSTDDRVLVYNQTNAAHNGIYTVTNTGSASTNWVLTRATDADSYGASDPNSFGEGDAFFVKEGDTGAGELYVMNTSGTITFGTTNITFTIVAETAVYTGGTDITLDGTTFNLDSTISADTTGNAATATALATARTVSLTGAVTGSTSFDGSSNVNITTTATSDPTLTLSGDASGSATFTNLGNATLSVTVADDSHNHIISNIDGLQSALNAKQESSTALTTSTTFGGDVSGTYNAIVIADDSHNHIISNVDGLQTALDAAFVSASANNDTITFTTAGGTTSSVSISDAVLSTEQVQDIVGGMVTGNTESGLSVTYQDNDGTLDFALTNDPTITLTGAVTGSGTMTNLGNVSISTTATADPTLTLTGDVTGSATFTNLGNATLTATVANDSHTHDGRYYTESEADSRFVNVTGDTMSGFLTLHADPTSASHAATKNYIDSSINGLGSYTITRTSITATSGQTVFTASYDVGYVDVYQNGLKLDITQDFTASNGTSITLVEAAEAADVIEVVSAVGAFDVANTYTQAQADARYVQLTAANTFTADQTITGELTVGSYNESYAAVTSSSNATTINCESGNVFSHTLSQNTTFTFSSPPASGTAYAFSLRVVQDASGSGYTITWPTSVDWAAATAPTLTADANAVDWFVFNTVDGGTTWYGFTAGQGLG
jgi:hypothetical protein